MTGSSSTPGAGSGQRCALLIAVSFLLVGGSVFAQTQAIDPSRPSVFSVMWKWTPMLFDGFLLNLLMSALAMIGGTIVGVFVGLAQVSLLGPVRRSASLLTQILRNAPWLVAIFYAMYMLPYEVHVGGVLIKIPDWLKATLGFSLPVIANVSEIVRGGISSIPVQQWEAARSLAFTRRQTLWMIVLPQCAKRMLPPWMNLYSILTMATVLANVVGVSEAMTMTREILASERRSDLLLPMYGYILVWFFIYIFPISRLTLWLERKWAFKE
ncbi:amino acid ABC transporter permease [Ottowia thiooxydans]|uniref:Polar amino acid transport system permease protein n=1 Tax=Ottowia thiooxydans TaxID=219182 RepID=A0ABV2Q325_9BURK